MTRPRLSDVARRAGVSAMTVSNVINGRFRQMSPKTRHAVEKAIRDLGYRPHAAGRSLRLDEALNVGMLVVDEAPSFLSDPFTAHLIAGMTNYLSSRGYGVVVQGVKPDEFERSMFIRKFATDGLCILMSGPPEQYSERVRAVASLGQPTVLFETKVKEDYDNVCSIAQDNFGGGKKIAEHLLECGVSRVLLVLPRLSWPAILERRRGVEAVFRTNRGVDLDFVLCDEDLASTQAAIVQKLDAGFTPDAIIGGNDQMAIAAMNLVRRRGMRVPDDIMITGFNAFEFRSYADPLLTSVVSPVQQMGSKAAEELIRRIKTGSFSSKDIVFPAQLILGTSTQPNQVSLRCEARKARAS